MKNIYILFGAVFCSFSVLAQCPDGNVEFITQTQLDEFLIEYPDCSQIDGDLTLNSGFSDQITDLTPLSGITTVSGSLHIRKLDYYDSELEETVSTLLNGLENIISVGNLYIGKPMSIPGAPFLYGSIAPLSNIAGEVGEFWIVDAQFNQPLPDFPQISSIDYLRFSSVSGIEVTPIFSGLTTIRDFTIIQGGSTLDDLLSVIVIPENLVGVSPDNNPESDQAGIIVSGSNIQSVMGGASLINVDGQISISNVPLLEDLSGFDMVQNVGSIEMNVCRAGALNSFLNLQQAGYISVELHAPLCDNFAGNTVSIRFGQNAESLNVTGSTLLSGLKVHIDGIEVIEFTGNYTSLSKLEISSIGASTITGFETLTEISGSEDANLILNSPQLEQLPDFENLNFIEGALVLIPYSGTFGWLLTDLAGLENLSHLGALYIGPAPPMPVYHNLQTLNGLSGLVELPGNIVLRNLPMLADIEALGTTVNFGGMLSLHYLPAMENCGLSPTICHLSSSGEGLSVMGNNGAGCTDVNEIANSCATLSVEGSFFDKDFQVRLDRESQMHIYTGNQSGWFDLALVDQTGRIVFSLNIFLEGGHNVLPLRANLHSGIYLARIAHGQSVKTFKVPYLSQ